MTKQIDTNKQTNNNTSKPDFNKFRFIVSLVSLFAAYTSLVYYIGREYQYRLTAIELRRFFDLEAVIPEVTIANNRRIRLKRLYLVPYELDDIPRDVEEQNVYKVRLFKTVIDTEDVGHVITSRKLLPTPEIIRNFWESLSKVFASSSFNRYTLIEKVLAQDTQGERFDWRGYESNYDFVEEYIDSSTIRRYYNNGAILEYKLDEQGTSIPSSFRWIKLP